jgi:hypothetical protein
MAGRRLEALALALTKAERLAWFKAWLQGRRIDASRLDDGTVIFSVLSQVWPTDPAGVRLLATVSAVSMR